MRMKMNRLLWITAGLLFLGCSKYSPRMECIKGKLLINGICGNITIRVVGGKINPELIEKRWVDPATSIEHNNVFALYSICTFPSSIKEGDEFNFVIDNDPKGTDCMRCLAFRPVPAKGLLIKVCK